MFTTMESGIGCWGGLYSQQSIQCHFSFGDSSRWRRRVLFISEQQSQIWECRSSYWGTHIHCSFELRLIGVSAIILLLDGTILISYTFLIVYCLQQDRKTQIAWAGHHHHVIMFVTLKCSYLLSVIMLQFILFSVLFWFASCHSYSNMTMVLL